MRNKKVLFITQGAVIAAIYVVLTYIVILTKKSQKRKRNLRKSTVVDSTNVKSMKKALP